MATFVVVLGMSPSDYYNLTVLEREEIIKKHNEVNKQR